MKPEIIYDTIEVLSTDKLALQQAAKEGYTQYGLRGNHDERWLKMRRPVRSGKEPR
jgi:hypothetical protein